MKNQTSINHQAPPFGKQMLADAVCRPILFSTPMVKAIKSKRKTITRRIFKVGKEIVNHPQETVSFDYEIQEAVYNSLGGQSWYKCPYGQVGDIIWVRETFAEANCLTKGGNEFSHYVYKADGDPLHNHFKWKPSLFMPKSACRFFLEITDIKVERLQDISAEDIKAEGVTYTMDYYPILLEQWESLWVKINGQKSWDENPFVWTISFKVVECPYGFR